MSSNFGDSKMTTTTLQAGIVTAGSGGELVDMMLVTNDSRSAAWWKRRWQFGVNCGGVRDLVGTPIGQHLHVMHFEEWRAVVGENGA
jgi:hypothetical protein